MHELLYRAGVLVWFIAYMAVIYLLLHIVIARFARAPESRVLWFFGIVTGPLLAPVRALLPDDTPAARLRWLALAAYAAVWLGARLILQRMGP